MSVVLQNAQECYRENEYISVCSHRAGDYVCSTSICSVNVASVAYVVLLQFNAKKLFPLWSKSRSAGMEL